MPALRVSMDRLLWRLLRGASGASPAVLYVMEFRLGCDCPGSQHLPRTIGTCWCPWYWDMGTVEARVARHYALPVASYRDAVWPNMTSPPEDLSELWRCVDSGIHPTRIPHELVSDVVKFALGRLLMAQNHSNPSSRVVPTVAACIARTIATRVPYTSLELASSSCGGSAVAKSLSSADPALFEHSIISKSESWVFGSDIAGRSSAWIGAILADSAPHAASITFPLSFVTVATGYSHPIVPHIEITFLRSYIGFIDASVTINASGCDPLSLSVRGGQLMGSWKRHQSTPYTLSFSAVNQMAIEREDGFAELAISRSCSLLANTPYALTITLQAKSAHDNVHSAGKFKLIGIRWCSLYAQ